MAVIGLLVELGSTADDLLASILVGIWEIAVLGTSLETRPLNITDLNTSLEGHQTRHYNGYLTTSTSTKSTFWWISTMPLTIGVDVFQIAKRVIKFNPRYTQDNLGRG